jgi:protoporphyrinogen IX oxidase
LLYLWLKVVHIFAVTAWMAGLFYLPRLFVYHVSEEVGSRSDDVFKVMERKLLVLIMRPASVVAMLSGVGLVYLAEFWADVWLLLKLVGVFGLGVCHSLLEYHRREFAIGLRYRSGRYFRILNEVPTVLLFWVLVFVVLKPVLF